MNVMGAFEAQQRAGNGQKARKTGKRLGRRAKATLKGGWGQRLGINI